MPSVLRSRVVDSFADLKVRAIAMSGQLAGWLGWAPAPPSFYARSDSNWKARWAGHLLWLLIALASSFVLSLMIAISPVLAGGAMAFFLLAGTASPRHLFLLYVCVLGLTPQYLAFIRPGLPWISPQRGLLLLLLLKFGFDALFNDELRKLIAEKIRYNKLLWRNILGLFAIFFLSVVFSQNPVGSMSLFFQACLQWLLPLIACLILIRDDRDINLIFRLILICSLVTVVGACLEEHYRHRLWTELMPGDFLANNPSFRHGWRTEVRNGMYRAASIFSTQLSFGEYCALIAPISLYFAIAKKNWERFLGWAAYPGCVLGVFLSQSRGGFICVAFATVVFVIFMFMRPVIRGEMTHRKSIYLLLTVMALLVCLGIGAASHRVKVAFFGGAEVATSNDERQAQWQKGWPKILQRPVLGYGLGQSITIAGVGADKDSISVDSYVLTLLCDTGFAGMLAFFSYVVVMTLLLLRAYIFSKVEDYRFIALAAGFSGFLVFRLILSQFENHTLLFILTGLSFLLLKQYQQGTAPLISKSS